MPCYEVRTISVEFRAENRKLLADAIRATGMEVTSSTDTVLSLGYGAIVLNLANGKAEVQDGYQGKLNELKRAYSAEAVKAAAKKCQWGVKLQGNKAQITKVRW